MRRETSAAWVARLEKAGVPCSAINDMAQMRAHPQTAALGMVQPVPEIDLELMSLPLSLDGQRPAIRTRAPQSRRAQRPARRAVGAQQAIVIGERDCPRARGPTWSGGWRPGHGPTGNGGQRPLARGLNMRRECRRWLRQMA